VSPTGFTWPRCIPLFLVLLPGIGSERYGATRWLDFGFFAFQPSETAKVAVLLITASLLIRSEIGTVRQSLGVLGKLALAVGIPMVLILLQPDLKSAIVLPPMVFSMLYVSKLSSRFFAGALGAFFLS
jgi:rod shape determining protein RodA